MPRNASHKKLSRPLVETALLCDGVRKEVTGQETVVGVYAHRYLTPSFPAAFDPVLYLRVQFPSEGLYEAKIRVDHDKQIHFVSPITVPIGEQKQGALATIVLGPMPLTIQSPGKLVFLMNCFENEWEELTSIIMAESGSGDVASQAATFPEPRT